MLLTFVGRTEVYLLPPPAHPSTQHSSTVLIRYNNISVWGSICDDKRDRRDANVVGRMPDFPGVIVAHKESFFGQGSGTVWFDDVVCIGDEDSLDACFGLPGWRTGNFDPGHSEDAGVTSTTYPSGSSKNEAI